MPLDPPGFQERICHLTVGSSPQQQQAERNTEGDRGKRGSVAPSSKMVSLKLTSEPSPLPQSSSGASSFLHF